MNSGGRFIECGLCGSRNRNLANIVRRFAILEVSRNNEWPYFSLQEWALDSGYRIKLWRQLIVCGSLW